MLHLSVAVKSYGKLLVGELSLHKASAMSDHCPLHIYMYISVSMCVCVSHSVSRSSGF